MDCWTKKQVSKAAPPKAWWAREIVGASKHPYSAPEALSFTGGDAPDYVEEILGETAVADAGVFEPRAVAALWAKCKARATGGQLSNSDNMALVGVLSTQLLHHQYVRNRPAAGPAIRLRTDIDRCAAGAAA